MLFPLCRYHHACAKAKVEVLELLKELSAEMQDKINILVFSSIMLVIAKALFSHVRYNFITFYVFLCCYVFFFQFFFMYYMIAVKLSDFPCCKVNLKLAGELKIL